jgi:mono/diheme cytochrome c family protein
MTTLPTRTLLFAALCLLACSPLPAASPPARRAIPADHALKMARGRELFAKQVRAILTNNCVKCHGGEKTRSGLDMTSRTALLKGGENGAAVVLGKGKQSRLYLLAAHLDDPPMPPKGRKRLTKEQLASLATWIDLGAPYDKPLLDRTDPGGKKPLLVTEDDRRFWSFRPLRRVAPPAVKSPSWARNPIDRFILSRLQQKGLSPTAPADRRALIRRASFGLLGLPPTLGDVEAFLKDIRPGAYERLVDRLLASPHFGERWARHWLDIARFGESHGFEHDYDRPTAYPYRDFVIKAFNQDLPYDQFVKWQLAGDEIEPSNPLAMAATGFLAAGVHSTQITISQVEKERYDELDDIVRTVGTAMLGLTVGCARCHDHKYDPIPTKDYYRLVSIFTTTVRSEVDLPVDAATARAIKARHSAEQARLDLALKKYESEQLPRKFDAWLASKGKGLKPATWTLLEPVTSKSAGGATFTRLADGSLLATGKNPALDTYTFVVQTHQRGITALRLEALAHPSMVRGGPGRAGNGNFALSDLRVTAAPLRGGKAVPVKLVRPRATFEQRGLPVAATIDADPRSAWAVDPHFGKDHAAVYEVAAPVGFDGGTVLTFTLKFNNNTGHNIGRPRLSASMVKGRPELTGVPVPEKVQAVLARPDRTRLSGDQRDLLRRWFRTSDPQWRQLDAKATEHRRKGPPVPTLKAMICSEGLKPIRLHSQGADFLQQTHFLRRGDPNQKAGVAAPGYLQVLSRSPTSEKRWKVDPPAGCRTSYRRRSLAGWITDVEQGAGHLLARVIVNRLWQHHMGRGIVGTPGDFGLQGERPTHPELLDWLAGELIRNGWRLKPIHKLILTSSTYRQGSAFDRGKSKVDPDNRLHWRRVPRRLEAEVIRDSLLAVSGQLDRRFFGPGTLDKNHKRRAIYFFVKRSQLIPMMVLFDAPDALQGLDQRTTTTIAPQALLMMNNELVRGCATSFADRVAPQTKTAVANSVCAAYALALARAPSSQEEADSVAFLREQTASYRAEGKRTPERLALADFCQVLLELNEFIYVD